MATLVIKNLFLLLLSYRNRVFEKVIFQISWEIDLWIFLLIGFTIVIPHQSINIGINLIGLSCNTWWIENWHFILFIFVLIFDTWMLILLNALISKNSVQIDTFSSINISQKCLRLIDFSNTVLIESVSDIRVRINLFTCPYTIVHPWHVILLKPFFGFLFNFFILWINNRFYDNVSLSSSQNYLASICHYYVSNFFI